jgi:phosphatidylglycerophosphate synthase
VSLDVTASRLPDREEAIPLAAVPLLLIMFRAACAPAIVALAWRGVPGSVLAELLLAAFLSDVFDGAIARRIGVVTAALRHADSLVDTVFYAAAGLALLIAVPDAVFAASSFISVLIVVHVSRAVFELTKYGRRASYHMWSSRLWGVLLFVGLERAFLTNRPTILLIVALVAGIANEIEGFAASILLSHWRHDVPSLVHAVAQGRTERQRQRADENTFTDHAA